VELLKLSNSDNLTAQYFMTCLKVQYMVLLFSPYEGTWGIIWFSCWFTGSVSVQYNTIFYLTKYNVDHLNCYFSDKSVFNCTVCWRMTCYRTSNTKVIIFQFKELKSSFFENIMRPHSGNLGRSGYTYALLGNRTIWFIYV
jgi:hypothetical protein